MATIATTKMTLPLPGNLDNGFNGKDHGIDYTTKASNQTVSRLVNAPKDFLLTEFKQCSVLAPGDVATAAHPFVAVGLVRKTQYNMVEIVTEVEATPEMIRHKFHTAAVGGESMCFDGCCPGPSDCINGYAGEIVLKDAGEGKTQLEHTGYQEPALFHTCCFCCCCQLVAWGPIGAVFLGGDLDKLEAKYASQMSSQEASNPVGGGGGAPVTEGIIR